MPGVDIHRDIAQGVVGAVPEIEFVRGDTDVNGLRWFFGIQPLMHLGPDIRELGICSSGKHQTLRWATRMRARITTATAFRIKVSANNTNTVE
jgi:hypothetical protein